MGTIMGLTAGLYQALNLLGAAGGRPNSFQTVQVVNATLCAVFAVSSYFGGSVLNTVGPAITGVLGVIGFAVYVASLWFFDQTGHEWFPILGGVMIGVCLRQLLNKYPNTDVTKAVCRPAMGRPGVHCHVILGGRRARILYRN